MQMPNSAKVVPSRSTPVLWRTAEAMATGKAMVSAMAMASSASCRLGRMRRLTFSRTGSPLRAERPVEPQLAAQALLRARVRRLRHHGVDRIARREVQQREHARRDEEQDGDGGEQPAEDYFSHTSLKRIMPSGIAS